VLPGDRDATPLDVDADASRVDRGTRVERASRHDGSSREELVDRHRLDDVVVGATAQRGGAAAEIVAIGEDDDGEGPGGPQPGTERGAVDPAHFAVDDREVDHCWVWRAARGVAAVATSCPRRWIALCSEAATARRRVPAGFVGRALADAAVTAVPRSERRLPRSRHPKVQDRTTVAARLSPVPPPPAAGASSSRGTPAAARDARETLGTQEVRRAFDRPGLAAPEPGTGRRASDAASTTGVAGTTSAESR
jgi:hypothetical protein